MSLLFRRVLVEWTLSLAGWRWNSREQNTYIFPLMGCYLFWVQIGTLYLKLSLWLNPWPDEEHRSTWGWGAAGVGLLRAAGFIKGVMRPPHHRLCACQSPHACSLLPSSPSGCLPSLPVWLRKCCFQLLSGALQLFPLLLPSLFTLLQVASHCLIMPLAFLFPSSLPFLSGWCITNLSPEYFGNATKRKWTIQIHTLSPPLYHHHP